MKKTTVAVLVGGPSSEHDVSLATGEVIRGFLDAQKYNIVPVSITRHGKWILPEKTAEFSAAAALSELRNTYAVDVVFIAMHGAFGEDGTVQALLEAEGLPYTGSGVLASALAMDKVRSSRLFSAHGLSVAPFVALKKIDWLQNSARVIEACNVSVGMPCVVKPACGGSSVGVSIVHAKENLHKALENSFALEPTAIVQQYVKGDEVTCAVLDEGTDSRPIALPPTQIIPKTSSFFDYEAKYTPGGSEEVTPPRLPEQTIRAIQEAAVVAHEALGCYGMSRTDMIVKDGQLYILETNTIPGMTRTSLYPQAAAAVGISFPQLLDKLITSALRR